MIPGYRFITEEPLNCGNSVQVFHSEEETFQYTCFSGVGITHIVTSSEESIDKISELIRLKFDYSITTPKVFLVWTTNAFEAEKLENCDDIDSDRSRFIKLGEHLIKGVV